MKLKQNNIYEEGYDIIDDINYYTFVDYIDNENDKISNFFYKSKKYERLIYYDLKEWLIYLIETYKDKKEMNKLIWEQYKRDATRSYIYINNKLLKDVRNIRNYIRDYKNIINIYILIILTQVIFVIPFSIIQNNIKDYNYILSELSHKDIKRYNRYINNLNKNNIYKCIFNKKDIIIKITKYLRIFKLIKSYDKTISIIKIDIEFSLKKSKYSIFRINFIPIVL